MINFILSLSIEAKIIITEIMAIIGIIIIISIYSRNQIKFSNNENLNIKHSKRIKLLILPILITILSVIFIIIQISFSWNKLITQIKPTNASQNTSTNTDISSNTKITNTQIPQTNQTTNNIIKNEISSQNTINETTIQNKVEEPKNNEDKTQINKTHENQITEPKNTTTNTKSIAYLTFDDGPSNITNSVLDILKKYNVKATFFVINSPSYNKTTLQREVREGHTIGLHAYSHNYAIAYKDDNSYLDGIDKLRAQVKSDTGYDSHYIRFPGGSSNTISKKYSKGIMTRITKMAKQREYKYYDWNVDDDDAGRAKTADDCYNNVIRELKPNRSNIVLMHDFGTNKKILEALPRIIEYCQKNGYKMLPIDNNTPEIHHGIAN